MKKTIILFALLLSIFIANTAFAITINVPGDYPTIQAALNAANSADIVLVATGTYYENIFWPTTNGIKLLSQTGADNTIIDGSNNSVVLTILGATGIDTTTVIDGFKIQNGTAEAGGGITCNNASPLIKNCIITNNDGGGMQFTNSLAVIRNSEISNNSGSGIKCLDNSNLTISDVNICDNTSYYSGGGISFNESSPSLDNVSIIGNSVVGDEDYGGSGCGVYCNMYSNPSLSNVIIYNNSIITSYYGNSSQGGGIYIGWHCSPNLTNVIINNNLATRPPGMQSRGGGVYMGGHCNPTFLNVIIANNSANISAPGGYSCAEGGGIFCNYNSDLSLTNVKIIGNSVYAENGNGGGLYGNENVGLISNNVTISDNSAVYGGGIFLNEVISMVFENITITRNTAERGGAIFCDQGSDFSVTHCTITENNAIIEGDGINTTEGSNPPIHYSNIMLNGYGIYNSDSSIMIDASNNYWGNVTGPYHPWNPGGLGDSLNAYVNPLPFLTAADITAPPIPPFGVEITDVANDFISLSWLPSPIGDLAGYKVYFDTDSTGYYYANSVDVGLNTSHTLSGLSFGDTYYIAISCYDTDGNESWFSKEVSAVTRALEVQNLDIGGDEDLQHLITHIPAITFDYYDSMGEPQSHYHIQVSTNLDFSVIDMWDTGEVASANTVIQYNGNVLIDGTTYYLRVKVATEQGSFWSDWATLQFRMNSLPSIPVLLSPINDEIVNVANPYLWIENSTDAELDTLIYYFELATEESFNNIFFIQSGVPEGIDSTSCQVTTTLIDNFQYWWRARTNDGYQFCNYSNPGSFILNAENEPPGEFELLTPENGTEVTTLTPILDWEDAIDPDPLDEVSYTILIGDEIPNLISIDAGNESVYQLTTPLEDNTLYYWKVIATDLYGASTENTGGFHTFIVNTENNDPNSFDLITPTEYSVEIDLTPIFYWENAGDPDIGDTLTYFLYYDMDSLFIETDPVETDSNHYIPTVPLNDNSTYFWKVIAVDEEGFRASIESETWLFWTNTELEPPNPFDLISPEDGEEGLPTTPEFVWNIATDNDPNDYAVYNLLISEDSTFTQVDYLAEGLIDTFFVIFDELTDSTRYFWRIDAVDTDSLVTSSEVWSFTVGNIAIDENPITPSEYILYQNNPNPFYNVTHISYSLPYPGNVRLQIYNIKGQLVETLVDENKPAGYHSVEWNVLDKSGMSSGIYFYKLSTKDKTLIKKMILIR